MLFAGADPLTSHALRIGGAPKGGPSTGGPLLGRYDVETDRVLSPWEGTNPWGGMYASDIDDEAGYGTSLVSITGNIVARTLPSAASYSAWGFGDVFTTAGFTDPVVNEADFAMSGVCLMGDMSDAVVGDNSIIGFRAGAGIFLRRTGTGLADRKFENVRIVANHVSDCGKGVAHNQETVAHWDIDLANNSFDLDPYHVHAHRKQPIDGTWVEQAQGRNPAACIAIDIGDVRGWRVRANRFKNCYSAFPVLPEETVWANIDGLGNTVDCQPAGDYYNALNRGVAYLHIWPEGLIHRNVGCDPRDTTFGKLINTPLNVFYAKPATGFYMRGHLIRNIGANGVGNIFGWVKQISGEGNTNWATISAT